MLTANAISVLVFPLLLILAIVSYARKGSPIGGWLFFVCGHIYLNVLAGLLVLLSNLSIYSSIHTIGLERYLAMLGARLPLTAVGIIGAVALTILLVEFTWEALIRLRYILVALACSSLLTLIIDLRYFPSAVPQRVGGLVSALLWLAYFYQSTRVQLVFLTHQWDGEAILPSRK